MKLTAIRYNDFTEDVKNALIEGAREAVKAYGRGEVVVRPITIGDEPLFAHYNVDGADGDVVGINLLTTEDPAVLYNLVVVQTPDDIGYGCLDLGFSEYADGQAAWFDIRMPNEYDYSLLYN